MKRFLSLILCFMLLTCALPLASGAENSDVQTVLDATGDYMASLGAPVAGSTGGEWMVLGFARSGREVDASYYDSVVSLVDEKIDENGRLHATKCTLNCRYIIALTAIGKDVTDVGGHDLLRGLNDLGYIKKVGVTGVIWTLLAFDSGNYPMPTGIDRDMLVNAILGYETPTGGWANSGSKPDPDVTAMALQALAPYRDREAVAGSIDRALDILSQMQNADGDFVGDYGASSETNAQVVVALSTLGIDANSDSRFVKNGVSALDALLRFALDDGGFRHILTGKRDGIATEQGFYALVAYTRFQAGQTPLYDMSDVGIVAVAPTKAEVSARVPHLWVLAVLAVSAVLMLACVLLRGKLRKKRFSNAIMGIVILTIVTLGAGVAVELGAFAPKAEIGSEFVTASIPDDRLVTNEGTQNLCTVRISCDTILENLSSLDDAKRPYLPADGVILPAVTVEFAQGESVFDVLKRVCEAAQIPLEYSWTPLYDSYYLEGICHIYEYDCGAESGWMYAVNGIYPNYGCSSYEVCAGDEIVWRYTCIGLGSDLSADVMEKE